MEVFLKIIPNPKGLLMKFYPLLNVVLVSPEIPYNTGNIIRLCANVGANLHLVEPLGFVLDDSRLRRASLDYRDLTSVQVHHSLEGIFNLSKPERTFGASASGNSPYTAPNYRRGDTIIFGSEGVGLDDSVMSKIQSANQIHIPMVPANRSLNLSNAVAILVYELWRQLGFAGSSFEGAQKKHYYS